MTLNKYLFLFLCIVLLGFQSNTTKNDYCWKKNYSIEQSIEKRIPPPSGFKRIEITKNSFADWLRYLPLKQAGSKVLLFDGTLKSPQNVHYAVVDIDVGNKDLQQCADAVMRIRAEYLFSKKEYDNIHFNFTSGHTIAFKKWAEGYRVVVKSNNVSWVKTAQPDYSYNSFREYCNTIFNYAGTASLSKELKKVNKLSEMQIGDVFIKGGFPGHAVLVVDMCENKTTGEKLFMVQQSYMPAQEIHILKNFGNESISPWYSLNFSDKLVTPEWTFDKNQLMRW